MRTRITFRDIAQEKRLFTGRVVVAAVVMLLLTLALVARLAWLQIINADHFATLSHNNRISVVPLPPTRGIIYDRNGVILAQNLPSYSLEIVPERTPNLQQTIDELAEIIRIGEHDRERFFQERALRRRFESIPIRTRLTEEEAARFAVHSHRFPGVEIEARLIRHYPHGMSTAHVVGYVGRINALDMERIDRSAYTGTNHIGKIGLERQYEDLLLGRVGFQQVETNALGRVLRVLDRTPPYPGNDLILHLDIGLQQAAMAAFGEERGAAVVLDPHTGAVLAMASVPGYDPNPFVQGIGRAAYSALLESPERPLNDRALRGLYAPGSTVKPFIALAGLELGEITPQWTVFSRGWFQLPGDERRYRDWRRRGHGLTDLNKSLVESVDTYYYELAHRLGIDRLSSYLAPFGFGQRTGIDIPNELGGVLPSREWKRGARGMAWFPGETVITGIGQGFWLTTPLQLASTTAILANRGERIEPRLLREVVGSEPITLEPPQRESLRVVRRSNWDAVIEGMVNSVHGQGGTARRIAPGLPWQVAGKTGTAQVVGAPQDDDDFDSSTLPKHLHNHALFIAFAPAHAPEIAVAVVVEHGGSGGRVAAPIARRILDHYFDLTPLEERP